MQEKTRNYFILLCLFCGIMATEDAFCAMQTAKALSQISGAAPVMVQVKSSDSTITLDYSVPKATLTTLDEQSPCPKGTCTKIRARAGNAIQRDREGEPVVPVIPSTIVIPAGKSIDNITVERTGEFQHAGEYFLEFGEKTIPISCTTCYAAAEPNHDIYYSDNQFPTIMYELVTVQNKCGVAIAYINLYPVTYYPLSGRVVSFRSLSLKVTLKNHGSVMYDIACRPERVFPKNMGIENTEALQTYTPEYCEQVRLTLPTGGICDPAETYEYVVITTENLKNATPFRPLSYLINWRKGSPFFLTATVVTTDGTNGIYNNYIGSERPDDHVDKIRSFIRNAYNNWETKYVLIIGDPNANDPNNPENCIVPMRTLYGINTVDDVPRRLFSDVYLQCLEGPYNFNSNPDPQKDYWGEKTDGAGGGEVDLCADVFIGRAFVENAEEMSNFIYKTTTYENAVLNNDPYTNNSLMVGELLLSPDLHAKIWMEHIRIGTDKFGYKSYGFNSSLIAAQTLYTPDVAWDKNDIIERLNSNNYSIINHLGHGLTYSLMRLESVNDVLSLTNSKLPFIYSQACLVGQPYTSTIGEDITTRTQSGAWGAIFNTREGLGVATPNNEGPSQKMNRQFWDAYFYEGLLSVGEMNADSHEDNLWCIWDCNVRWCYFITTLFGDPFTPFKDPIPCERYLDIGGFTGYNDVLARKLIHAGSSAVLNIESGANVTFVSGKEIRFLPSFKVNNGAKFKSFIDPVLYKSECE